MALFLGQIRVLGFGLGFCLGIDWGIAALQTCYWANQGNTGKYVFGVRGRGDCGSSYYPTSDQYNLNSTLGHMWYEEGWAVYIAGLNISSTT